MKVGDAFRILRNTSDYSYPLWISSMASEPSVFFLSSDMKPPRQPPVCLRMINPPVLNGFEELLYNVATALPTSLFVLFLFTRLRSSVQKLLNSRSYIMRTYYTFIWVICVLNLCWCLLKTQHSRNGDKETAWNIMSLGTRYFCNSRCVGNSCRHVWIRSPAFHRAG